ncbi:hypothetical protein [Flavobacterium alkalisoli]|uniref:hypothetical protein n=1 Tax=Flavobacterium alkalisoli TaxID=2602769 RepID=UPI003A939C0F
MRYSFLLLVFGIFAVSLTSCRNDFEFEPNPGGLEFSKDTVYLDTVFTNIGSSTYTLKVYNRSDKDIKIPTLQLGQGNDSKYRMMVDGMPGRVFNDVELLAKDSMFIFIETTIDYTEFTNNENTFLYTDHIEFHSTQSAPQKVELVTLVQDAIFLFPQRNDEGQYESIPISEVDDTQIYGFNLDETENGNELIWTNAKPYVVYGYGAVPPGKTLTVNPGARVHFHANSGLIVRNGATMNIGSPSDPATEANQVVFEGDRLEPDFADIPGQWGAIWLQEGSTSNFNNAIIKNNTVGILMEGNNGTAQALSLRNVQLYNSTNVGLLSRNGTIYGENVVINMAGQASFAATLGGFYNFKHCTFANYFNSFNQVPVLISDYQETEDAILVNNLTATFDNCILYGTSNFGFLFDRVGELPFEYKFNNCFIKFIDSTNRFTNNPMYNFGDQSLFNEGCTIAQNSTTYKPFFEDPNNNKLNISDDSAANGLGNTTTAAQVPFDIVNTSRNTTAPDAGAYESAAFTED